MSKQDKKHTYPVLETASTSSAVFKLTKEMNATAATLDRPFSWTPSSIFGDGSDDTKGMSRESLKMIMANPNPGFREAVASETSCRKPMLPPSNPSFDIAYFLKTTGPPPPRSVNLGGQGTTLVKRKGPLNFLKNGGRRGGFAKLGDRQRTNFSINASQQAFIPPEGCVQRVSRGGKKYLQIVIDGKEAIHEDSVRKQINASPESGGLSEAPETLGTDSLDTWITSLALQRERSNEHTSFRPESGLEESPTKVQWPGSASPVVSRLTSKKPSSIISECEFAITCGGYPDVDDTCVGALDVKAALTSNPPSSQLHQPLPAMQDCQGVKVSTQKDDSQDNQTPSRIMSSNVDILIEEEELGVAGKPSKLYSAEKDREEQGYESTQLSRVVVGEEIGDTESKEEREHLPLVGQGSRRPFIEKKWSSGNSCSQNLVEVVRDNNEQVRTESMVDRVKALLQNPGEEGQKVPVPLIRSREQRIRARKLRDLHRTRRNLDEAMQRPLRQQSIEGPVRRTRLRPPSIDVRTPSVDYETGYTPTENMALSPVMLVAEQVPLPRAKLIRKPTKLILHEGKTSVKSTLAIRGDEALAQSPGDSVTVNASNVGDGINSRSRETIRMVSDQEPRGGSDQQNSTISCESSTGIDALREERIGTLEKKNRLLEAALMAVLKSCGTLNRCPYTTEDPSENNEVRKAKTSELELFLQSIAGDRGLL